MNQLFGKGGVGGSFVVGLPNHLIGSCCDQNNMKEATRKHHYGCALIGILKNHPFRTPQKSWLGERWLSPIHVCTWKFSKEKNAMGHLNLNDPLWQRWILNPILFSELEKCGGRQWCGQEWWVTINSGYQIFAKLVFCSHEDMVQVLRLDSSVVGQLSECRHLQIYACFRTAQVKNESRRICYTRSAQVTYCPCSTFRNETGTSPHKNDSTEAMNSRTMTAGLVPNIQETF